MGVLCNYKMLLALTLMLIKATVAQIHHVRERFRLLSW